MILPQMVDKNWKNLQKKSVEASPIQKRISRFLLFPAWISLKVPCQKLKPWLSKAYIQMPLMLPWMMNSRSLVYFFRFRVLRPSIGENKIHGTVLQVERDIKKPFNYFVQRESMANLNVVMNPENDDKTKKTPSKMGIFWPKISLFTLPRLTCSRYRT